MLVNKISINKDATIKFCMKMLTSVGTKCLLVVDSKNKLLGTLTDGDVRRAILKNAKLDSKITNIFNKKPIYIRTNDFTKKLAQKKMKENLIDLIPVIDSHGTVKKFITSENISKDFIKSKNSVPKNFPVIIMAGGKGTRMSPFTNILPKPLLPINDKTMVENILDNFYESGFKNFIFTLNYKAKVLRAYIQEIKKNYSVKFTEEKKPLGTAGALKLIKNLIKSDMIVTNCDTSIQIDFSELIKFHVTKKNLITLVASSKEYRLPYGVCSLDKKGNLLSIQEKPSYDYLVNSGTYVINKKALKYIPNDKYFDMTDLINVIMKKNLKISLFPIHEDSWYDTGDWEQYRNVFSKMSIK